VSPIRITGLTNGVVYPVRVRAVNHAGPGAGSAVVRGMPLPAPDAPAALSVVAQTGRVVTLQWTPAPGGLPATGYVVEGGENSGEVQASIPVSSGLPTLTLDVPPGSFYVRVHTVAGPAWSPPSNEIRIFIERAVVPSRPLGLRSLVSGSTVSLSWTNTFTGGAPTGMVLSVTGALSTSLLLPLSESFRVSGVPPGVYNVRVRAVNAAGESASSLEERLVVPAACGDPSQGPPAAPADFTASASGQAYYLAWAPPAGGSAVESYVVRVAGAFTGTLTTTRRSLSGVAAAGEYTVTVAAMNSCGVGAATAPASVVIR
jgi:titin